MMKSRMGQTISDSQNCFRPHQHGKGEVGPQHVHGRVGEIQDVHHPEDQRETRRDQEQEPCIPEAVEKKNRDLTHRKHLVLNSNKH
jgi:hypothetical protein